MKCQVLFSELNKKRDHLFLSSAEVPQSLLSVKCFNLSICREKNMKN